MKTPIERPKPKKPRKINIECWKADGVYHFESNVLEFEKHIIFNDIEKLKKFIFYNIEFELNFK